MISVCIFSFRLFAMLAASTPKKLQKNICSKFSLRHLTFSFGETSQKFLARCSQKMKGYKEVLKKFGRCNCSSRHNQCGFQKKLPIFFTACLLILCSYQNSRTFSLDLIEVLTNVFSLVTFCHKQPILDSKDADQNSLTPEVLLRFFAFLSLFIGFVHQNLFTAESFFGFLTNFFKNNFFKFELFWAVSSTLVWVSNIVQKILNCLITKRNNCFTFIYKILSKKINSTVKNKVVHTV